MSNNHKQATEANIIKTLIEELSKNSEFVDTIKNLERLIISLAPSIVKKITGNIITKEIANLLPSAKKEKKTRKDKKVDWTKVKEVGLRQAHSYRNKKGMPIEDELNEELARRFPGYDKGTKTFGHTKKEQKSKILKPLKNSQQEKPKTIVRNNNLKLPLFSCLTNTNKYSLYFDNGNNTENLLKASKAPYELCLFDEKIQMAIIRKKTDINSYLLYVVDLKKGKIFSSFKQGVKIIRYNAKTHEIFVAAEKAYSYTIISRDSTTHKYMNIPTYAETIKADSLQKNTILVNKDGKETTCPVIKISEQKDLGTQNQKIETFLNSTSSEKVSTVNNTTTTLEIPKEEEPTKEETTAVHIPEPKDQENKAKSEISYTSTEIKYQNLVVSVKQNKITFDGIYNDIFVNDKKILSNHITTQINLLG